MNRNGKKGEPGFLDREYWQEDLGPGFRRFIRIIWITMVAGTALYLAAVYLVLP